MTRLRPHRSGPAHRGPGLPSQHDAVPRGSGGSRPPPVTPDPGDRGVRRAVLGLTALALVVRIATLDARGFWVDEIITIDFVRGGLDDVAARLDDFSVDQPPVYYLLAWAWAQILGTGEVGLRLLPAVCGALTVPCAYLAGRTLASRRAGVAAALLTALSPLVIWHSQDARPYALVILLCGASFALFARGITAGGPRVLWAWALVSVLAVATHYMAVFLVAAEVGWMLVARRDPRVVLGAVGAVGVATAALGFHARGGRALGDGSWTQSYSESDKLVQVPAQLLVGYQPPLQLAAAVAAAVLAGLAVALLAVRGDRSERSAALPAIVVAAVAAGVPMLLSASGHLSGFTTRYVVGAWVPLAVVAGIALTVRRATRAGVVVGSALCALFVAVAAGSAWEPKFDREDWRGAARALGGANVDRAVVVSPDTGLRPLEYYLPHAREAPDAGARVRQVVLLALPRPYRRPGQEPRPPRPRSVPPPAPGFTLLARRDEQLFTLIVFGARSARRVTERQLVEHALGDSSAGVLVQSAPPR